MKTLHILKSKPDENTRALLEILTEGENAVTSPFTRKKPTMTASSISYLKMTGPFHGGDVGKYGHIKKAPGHPGAFFIENLLSCLNETGPNLPFLIQINLVSFILGVSQRIRFFDLFFGPGLYVQ